MYAFSFCLYGPPNPKYYNGLLQNLELISNHFPGWVVYVYTGADVPPSFVEQLIQKNVRVRPIQRTGHTMSLYRFLAIDEPDIDVVMVRDADSRVHHRDRWAIRDFLESTYRSHAIRDHPYHTTHILAGLLGLKKGSYLPSMSTLLQPYLDRTGVFGIDQTFLSEVLYPILKERLLVHTSQSYRYSREETHAPFPWAFTDACYCGRVEGDQTIRPPQRGLPILQRIFRR